MSGSHGRAARIVRAWISPALVASGLLAALGSNPALACKVESKPKPKPKPAAQQLVPTAMPSKSATDAFNKAAQDFMKTWKEQTAIKPPAIIPTLATAKPPAAQTLAPTTPTVANHGTGQPCGCPPPPPCTVPPPSTSTPPTGVTPPPASQGLEPPAGITEPTPVPEPSTILSALAMVGAVAWRRRATRSRA
ncbi:PEP-CTERM sorting domain-containing protein [Tundrisphaera lichenicola]|uniref:PEP-CTERM sorting domain-containing protein n=1 Tax=Tundrisphaera lichenicola TaxID=2029860 RepID=UPI003EB7069F